MDRSKKVVFISHCILNQNSVVCPLARAKGAYTDIIKVLMEKGVGIHQLPCPEFRHLGLERRPMTKEEYDTLEFRNLCKSIAEDTIGIMKEYIRADYEIVGLIGINQSPTCSIKDSKGICMEELFKLIEENEIEVKSLDVDVDYRDEEDNQGFLEQVWKL